jgi:GntR family transcriptional regulator
MSDYQAIPLYYQIENVLRSKILSGDLEPLHRIHTEKQLSEEFKVSRITIRKALENLEHDGYIVRKRGKGSYITEWHKKMGKNRSAASLNNFTNIANFDETKLLNYEWIMPPKRLLGVLGMAKTDKVLYIERCKSIDKEPCLYIKTFLPYEIGKRIEKKDLKTESILSIMENKLRLKISAIKERIEACIADHDIADVLDMHFGEPILKKEFTSYNSQQKALEHSIAFYKASRYHCSLTRQRDNVDRPMYTAYFE